MLLLALGGAACAGNRSGDPRDEGPPRIAFMSASAARVGDPIDFECEHCVNPDQGWVDVHFVGKYTRQVDGKVVDVDHTVPLRLSNQDSKRLHMWQLGGGTRIPFDERNCGVEENMLPCSVGVFQGTVHATNRYYDGHSVDQPKNTYLKVERFEVKPSIIIRAFLPFDDVGGWYAPCRYPVRVALPGVDYMLDVEAIGFDLKTLEYVVSDGLIQDGKYLEKEYRPPAYRRPSGTEPRHRLIMRFAPVPLFAKSEKGTAFNRYRMNIQISGSGEGQRVGLNYSFVVSPMITTQPRSGWQIGQFFAPAAAGSCEGGPIGQAVGYSYAKTETATRSFTTTENNNWQESVGEAHQDGFSKGESFNRSFSDTESTNSTDTRSKGNTSSANAGRSVGLSRTLAAAINGGSTTNLGQVAGLDANAMAKESDSASADLEANINRSNSQSHTFGTGSPSFIVNQDTDSRSQGGSAESGISRTTGGELQNSASQNFSANSAFGTNDGTSFNDSTGVNANESVGRARGLSDTFTQSSGEAASSTTSDSIGRTDGYSKTVNNSINFARSRGDSLATMTQVSESTTTTQSVQASIPGGWYGVWYKQKVRLVQFSDVIAYDLCGQGTVVGSTFIDDYAWGYSLGLSNSCSPLPRSCFPKAQCLLPDLNQCEEQIGAGGGDDPPPECSAFSFTYDWVFRTDWQRNLREQGPVQAPQPAQVQSK